MPELQEPYCGVDDLMFGNIPAPSDASVWCSRAAQEIDSYIGLIYATPVVLNNSTEQRPGRLLLKNINAWLATGRAIMALGGGGSDDQTQQYGLYLVNEALGVLRQIVDGMITIPGAEPTTPTDDGYARPTGPLLGNVDEDSYVEGYNTYFGNNNQRALDNAALVNYPSGFYLTR